MSQPAAAHDKNVYVLGAGFSADAGIPLVRDFLQAARELHRNPASEMTADLRGQYDQLFRFRDEVRRARDVVALPLEDIEVLFSLIETAVMAGAHPAAIRDSLKHVVADTIERCRREPRLLRVGLDTAMSLPLIEQLRASGKQTSTSGNVHYFDVNEYALAVGTMAGAFDPAGTENVILTFNYDTVVEDALQVLGYSPDYGSARLKWNGGPPKGQQIKVLKLHGSINWADLHNEHPAVYQKYSDTGTAHAPILVPPTWNKSALHPVMADVWSEAYRHLKSATRICIVGYSMPPTDAYFKYFLGAALAENPGLYSLGIVDTRADAIAVRRFAKFFAPLAEYRKVTFLGHWHDPLDRGDVGGLLGFLLGCRFREVGRGAGIASVVMP